MLLWRGGNPSPFQALGAQWLDAPTVARQGYEAVMADPAGKIGDMAAMTLKELPAAAATARAKADDKDVVSDVESLLKK